MLQTASFSGHESFPLRHTWLTKGVRHCAGNPLIFSSDDAMAILGVGKNMVRSIRHWCLVTGMLERVQRNGKRRAKGFTPTPLATSLFLGKKPWDPFLEDVGTLWLIHWEMVTNGRLATTWYYAFNKLNRPDFTKAMIEESLAGLAGQIKATRASRNTIRRDVDVFLRTYVRSSASARNEPLEDTLDSPLVELGLIRHAHGPGAYVFNRGPQTDLPDDILLFVLAEYASTHAITSTVAFDDLAYGDRSPGRAFKLDEPSLGERLEKLASLSNGALHFSETAGLRQVVFAKRLEPNKILESYYRRAARAVRRGK